MDQNNQPVTNNQYVPPVTPAPAPVEAPHTEKKVGPIIASLIIVLVLIFAALYVFASRVTQPSITDSNVADTSETASTSDSVKPVTGTATDVKSLQADLNASTNGLDNQNF